MFRKIVVALACVFIGTQTLHAENGYHWVFGNGAGLRFDYIAGAYIPTPTDGFALNSVEAASSLADDDGNVFLYTDGVSLWDGSHQDISFDVSLEANRSSTHGAVLIPYPGWPRRYIILTQGLDEDSSLYYTVYNMTGDVPFFETDAPIPLVGSVVPDGFPSSEKVAVLPGEDLSSANVVFVSDLGEIYVVPLTRDGFGTFQNYLPAPATAGIYGQIAFAPNGQYIATANYIGNNVRLMPFDPLTATPDVASLSVYTAPTEEELVYSLAFSPSGNRLFMGIIDQVNQLDKVVYFDIVGGTLGAPTVLITQAPDFSYGQMRLGPDGVIYITQPSNSGGQGGTGFLATITDPDGMPILTRDAVALAGTSLGRVGLSTHPVWVGTPCGDGVVDWGETCDDGNRVAGDGCGPMCQIEGCIDRRLNGSETDADCGGPDCPSCWDGYICVDNSDCFFQNCEDVNGTNRCVSHCTDGVANEDETDLDCGGELCLPCSEGLLCQTDADCEADTRCNIFSGEPRCERGVPTCEDGLFNGFETGPDCGGPHCGPCTLGFPCDSDADCIEGATCTERLGTTICVEHCDNDVRDADEVGVDCGGASCDLCPLESECETDEDCASGICDTGRQVPECVRLDTCRDGVQNGEETDVDCGGSLCRACELGESCLEDSDCGVNACFDEVCEERVDLVRPSGPASLRTVVETSLDTIPAPEYLLTGGGCTSQQGFGFIAIGLLGLMRRRK